MERWAISDLHIGQKGEKWDDFHQDRELIYFLSSIPSKSLRGVGDILELWQGDWRKIIRSRRKLINLLFSRMEYWVIGNHDTNAWNYRRLIPSTTILCDYLIEDGILYMHGHQFDIFNSRFKKVGKAVTKIAGLFEKRIHPDVDHWLSGLKDKMSRTGRYGKDKDYAKNAINFASGIISDGSRIEQVILGHTHRRIKYERKGVLYQNCGCWIGDKQNTVKI